MLGHADAWPSIVLRPSTHQVTRTWIKQDDGAKSGDLEQVDAHRAQLGHELRADAVEQDAHAGGVRRVTRDRHVARELDALFDRRHLHRRRLRRVRTRPANRTRGSGAGRNTSKEARRAEREQSDEQLVPSCI